MPLTPKHPYSHPGSSLPPGIDTPPAVDLGYTTRPAQGATDPELDSNASGFLGVDPGRDKVDLGESSRARGTAGNLPGSDPQPVPTENPEADRPIDTVAQTAKEQTPEPDPRSRVAGAAGNLGMKGGTEEGGAQKPSRSNVSRPILSLDDVDEGAHSVEPQAPETAAKVRPDEPPAPSEPEPSELEVTTGHPSVNAGEEKPPEEPKHTSGDSADRTSSRGSRPILRGPYAGNDEDAANPTPQPAEPREEGAPGTETDSGSGGPPVGPPTSEPEGDEGIRDGPQRPSGTQAGRSTIRRPILSLDESDDGPIQAREVSPRQPDPPQNPGGAEQNPESTRQPWAPGQIPVALRQAVDILADRVNIGGILEADPRTEGVVSGILAEKTETQIGEELGLPLYEVSRTARGALEGLLDAAKAQGDIPDDVLARLPQPEGRVLEPGSYEARLRDAREAAGLTQTELADLLGVKWKAYSEYERGVRAIPYARHSRLLNELRARGGLTPEGYAELKAEFEARRNGGNNYEKLIELDTHLDEQGVDGRSTLAPRQQEILDLSRDGVPVKKIAERLGIPDSNVSKQIKKILKIWRDEMPDKLPVGETTPSPSAADYKEAAGGFNFAGEIVKERIERAGFTVPRLARELGIDPATLNRMLAGSSHPKESDVLGPVIEKLREREAHYRIRLSRNERDQFVRGWYAAEKREAKIEADAKLRATLRRKAGLG